MAPGRPTVQLRLDRGESGECAHSHHDRCSNTACKCQCHSNPQAFEKGKLSRVQAARRAWETRRGGHANDTTAAGAPERGKGETAPKRPEVKLSAKAAVPAGVAKQLKSEAALGLWIIDGAVAGFRPDVWTAEDRLNEAEITGIVNATYNEIEARCPQLLKILATAQGSAPEAALLYTLAMVALPRLARREVTIAGVKITPEFARAVAFAPLIIQQSRPAEPEPGAASVESEPAYVDRGFDRYGQVDVGGAFAQDAAVPAGAAVQTGHGAVSNGSSDQNSARNGRHEV